MKKYFKHFLSKCIFYLIVHDCIGVFHSISFVADGTFGAFELISLSYYVIFVFFQIT